MVSGEYKWSLRKGGKKIRCPQCGKMRFVPFVLTADPSVLAGEQYGRCDREQSCGYFRYPGKEVAVTNDAKPEPRPELPPALFPINELSDIWHTAAYLRNSLFVAYCPLVGSDRLAVEMMEYHVATGASGHCIFPQFDGHWMRTAKAIMYGADGHRLKGDDGEVFPVYWLHKAPQYDYYMQCHQLKQCLFGQHFLTIFPEWEVWIVEAEKTALLMAATDDRTHRLWLACGGSQMLKGAIDLSCLRGRDVTLVPDDGQYWNWKRTADANGWHCVDISLEHEAYGLPDGFDVWDLQEIDIKKTLKTDKL